MTPLATRGRLWTWGIAVLAVIGAIVGLGIAWPGLFPHDPLNAGRAAYDRGDWPRAAEAARERLKNASDDPEALRLLARSIARQGRDNTAQAIYGRLDAGAMQAEDYFLLADGLIREGRYDAAHTLLEKGLQRDPDHAEILNLLARFHAGADRLAEAADLAERLARQPGWDARAALLLGLVRNQQGDPAAAADALERALRPR